METNHLWDQKELNHFDNLIKIIYLLRYFHIEILFSSYFCSEVWCFLTLVSSAVLWFLSHILTESLQSQRSNIRPITVPKSQHQTYHSSKDPTADLSQSQRSNIRPITVPKIQHQTYHSPKDPTADLSKIQQQIYQRSNSRPIKFITRRFARFLTSRRFLLSE